MRRVQIEVDDALAIVVDSAAYSLQALLPLGCGIFANALPNAVVEEQKR
jgi:hypothetical protein